MTSSIALQPASSAISTSPMSARSTSNRPTSIPRSFRGMPLSKFLLLSRTSSNYRIHKRQQQQQQQKQLSSKVSKSASTTKNPPASHPYVMDLFLSFAPSDKDEAPRAVIAPLCQQPACARATYSELLSLKLKVDVVPIADDDDDDKYSVEDLAIEEDAL